MGSGVVHLGPGIHRSRLAEAILGMGRDLGAIVNVESDDEWFAERINERVLRNLKTYGVEPPHRVGPLDDLLTGDDLLKRLPHLRDLSPEAGKAARAAVTAPSRAEPISRRRPRDYWTWSRRASKAIRRSAWRDPGASRPTRWRRPATTTTTSRCSAGPGRASPWETLHRRRRSRRRTL